MSASGNNENVREMIEHIGRNLAAARGAYEWTQAKLAERAGISRSAIGKIESFNATEVSLGTILKLASALNIPPYLLFLRKQDWENLAGIGSLREMIIERKVTVDASALDEMERMARSDNIDEQRQGTKDIQDLVTSILGERIEVQNDETSTATIIPALAAAIAIAIRATPRASALNAVVAGMLASKRPSY